MAKDLSVLIIGSGAREHALSKAYEKSQQVERIIVAPGNDFISFGRQKEVILEKECSLKDPESFLRIATQYRPDLIDVAQDDALACGTVDLLQEQGFSVFGPAKSAARIEWDKRWSREFMQRHSIPCPNFKYFDSEMEGMRYMMGLYEKEPTKLLYTKAAGLCSGKGALRSKNIGEAVMNIKRMKGLPNGAGEVFLVEEGLKGEEFSYYAISDGKTHRSFKSAQDNKTALNFDEGEQTGGMGAISPARVTESITREIEETQISRAIEGMASEGGQYMGILYLGGIVVGGKPVNIEYNARWGDPECQVVLPSVETDYVDIVTACLEGKLDKIKIRQDDKTRVCVVGASRGYPGNYSSAKGKMVHGLEEAMESEGVIVLGAGIEVREGKFYANGGRMFSIIGEGKNILEAKRKAYSAISHISVEGNNLHYRTDIGWRDVERFLEFILVE